MPDFLRQFRVCQESKNVDTVIDGDNHNALTSKMATVKFGLRAGTIQIAAAVYPDHDR